MTRVYYKEAVGALIVFDVTRVSTFEAVQKWKKDIDQKVSGQACCHTLSWHGYKSTSCCVSYLAQAY